MIIWKLESKDCLHWHCLLLETFGGEILIQSVSVLYLESHYLFAYSDKEIPLALELEFFQIWY